MPIDLSVHVAVIRSNEVLLVLRHDVEAWALPGGQVDPGESLSGAAVREVQEETGIEIDLLCQVGIYSVPNWLEGDNHTVLFAARPRSNALRTQDGETIAARYWPADALPEPLIWWHRQRIQDAISGTVGAVWTQNVPWPFPGARTREAFYQIMADSGLSRPAFWERYFAMPTPRPQNLEVAEVRGSATPPSGAR